MILFGLLCSSHQPQEGSVYPSSFSVNILTPVLVFLTLWAAEVGQWGRLWPPWSSACRWSPAQRRSHVPPPTAPSTTPSTPPSLQHPAVSPYSSPPSAHSGCSLAWVLPLHHVGLKITARKTHISCFSPNFNPVIPPVSHLCYLLTSPWLTRFSLLCQGQPPEVWLSYSNKCTRTLGFLLRLKLGKKERKRKKVLIAINHRQTISYSVSRSIESWIRHPFILTLN